MKTATALAGLALLLCLPATGREPRKLDPAKLPPPAEGKMDFVKDIKPILEKKCLYCHWPSPGRLDIARRFPDTRYPYVHTRAEFMKGGRNGKPIIPGKSAESLIIHLVSNPDLGGADGPRMPPPPNVRSRLNRAEIGKLRAWIDQGVAWPDGVVLPLPKSEADAWKRRSDVISPSR